MCRVWLGSGTMPQCVMMSRSHGGHMVTVAPYGSWYSPISTELITGRRVPVSDPSFDGEDVYWLESRAEEGGRSVVVRRRPDGSTVDAVPDAANVRTRVHEYGGGDRTVR